MLHHQKPTPKYMDEKWLAHAHVVDHILAIDFDRVHQAVEVFINHRMYFTINDYIRIYYTKSQYNGYSLVVELVIIVIASTVIM